MPSKESGNPLLSWPDAATCDILDLLSQCPFAERYILVAEFIEPFNHNVFLDDAETLLGLMGLPCILVSSINPVSQCKIGNLKFDSSLLNGEVIVRRKSVLRMVEDASILQELLSLFLYSFTS